MEISTPAHSSKRTHTIVLDAGPLISNTPSISTLLASSEKLVTLPSVLAEIRDAAARDRIETTVKPCLDLREPRSASLQFVVGFARRTGDLAVLSKIDLSVLALAYEIECERNRGDWRLRKLPGQKQLNGCPPKKPPGAENAVGDTTTIDTASLIAKADIAISAPSRDSRRQDSAAVNAQGEFVAEKQSLSAEDLLDTLDSARIVEPPASVPPDGASPKEATFSMDHDPAHSGASAPDQQDNTSDESVASDSDSEDWITPSNLHKHQYSAPDTAGNPRPAELESTTLQCALITSDNALQNVALQINLNILSRSASMPRIQHLRTYVLRCHACFLMSREMSRQFCPRCGKPTLTRVACSTDASTGKCELHLKRNMQWNTRGDRYSIPKPAPGTSSGRAGSTGIGGGKGGWGRELILAEDQKEYVKAMNGTGRRRKQQDLMSDDSLPAIITGVRPDGGGRVIVGAGRNVNARKRR